MPLIITLPGGRKDHLVAAGIDLLPTIMELAGIEVQTDGEELKGVSLLSETADRVVISEALHLGRRSGVSVRSSLTYIVNGGKIEIYDQSDTRETENLLTTEKKTEEPTQTISEKLRKDLKAFGYLN